MLCLSSGQPGLDLFCSGIQLYIFLYIMLKTYRTEITLLKVLSIV